MRLLSGKSAGSAGQAFGLPDPARVSSRSHRVPSRVLGIVYARAGIAEILDSVMVLIALLFIRIR
jgi:hypothetical protein